MAPVANSLARRPVLGRGGASWRRTTKLTAISWYGSRSVSSYRQTANATSALPGTGPVTSRPVGETRRWAAAVGTRYCTPHWRALRTSTGRPTVRPSTVHERGSGASSAAGGREDRSMAAGALGDMGVQYSTCGDTVARGLLDHEGDHQPVPLPALAGEGGGPGERPHPRARGAGRQPPVVLRLLLPSSGRAQTGHLCGQGRVLPQLADRMVLPGRRADPHEPLRGGRLPACVGHGQGGARLRAGTGHLPRGDPGPRRAPAQGDDRDTAAEGQAGHA